MQFDRLVLCATSFLCRVCFRLNVFAGICQQVPSAESCCLTLCKEVLACALPLKRQSWKFLFGRLDSNTNIFIMTTLHTHTHTYIYIYIYIHTHTYIHAFLLYKHTFLSDKFYTHTYSKKKKFNIFNQNYV